MSRVELSEAEQKSLLTDEVALALDNLHSAWARKTLFAAVERIIAERMAQVLEDAGEAIDALTDPLSDQWYVRREVVAKCIRDRANALRDEVGR